MPRNITLMFLEDSTTIIIVIIYFQIHNYQIMQSIIFKFTIQLNQIYKTCHMTKNLRVFKTCYNEIIKIL